ncbi:NAD(P)-dependent alcohol dehydrogenase [uncultured Kriegella sp.]|uniref:NAD(P)-dependent alcohol dehydrogenase n=1 Tax=uncultured Kriegella sp. TaxID=1798910 RepID=UPI0030DA5D81|tara:strand:- start:226850 stop:227851 length:1002 start_codon:yes stop_codon:yes gene_type:complete
MKASIRRNYCLPSQLKIEQIEKPIPKDNEVLIRVYATTVNRTDCANLTAKPFIMRFVLGLFKPRKIIVGTDFAGEVIAIGKNVNSINMGDRVFGFNDTGSESQAEYLTTVTENTFTIPKNIDFKQAAASLEGAHYAYTFIHKVNIKSGQRILINGATGAIGSALLQFVRQYEVNITATCNTKNIELIQTLGADKIFDYTKKDFTDDSGKYDFIFDTVGKSTFGKCKSLLNKKGVYISSELGPYSQNVFYPLLNAISSKKVIFPIPYHKSETIPYISRHLAKGSFRPVVDREYQLKDIAKAYEYVIKGEKTGNVLINIKNNQSTIEPKQHSNTV